MKLTAVKQCNQRTKLVDQVPPVGLVSKIHSKIVQLLNEFPFQNLINYVLIMKMSASKLKLIFQKFNAHVSTGEGKHPVQTFQM